MSHRYKSSYIDPDECLVDFLKIDGEEFMRFYYYEYPTRYFISRHGKVWSEISRQFRSSKTGYIVIVVRDRNDDILTISMSIQRMIEETF